MLHIAAPIQLGDSGFVVSNLLRALDFLCRTDRLYYFGHSVVESSRIFNGSPPEPPYFGDATFQLIIHYQRQCGLPGHGAVDEPTAKQLNSHLAALGVLQHPNDPDDTWTVSGFVKNALGQPLAGLIATAFDLDLRRRQPLGAPTATDVDGRYLIRYKSEHFALAEGQPQPAPDIVIELSRDGAEQPLAASPIVFRAGRDEVVHFNLDLPEFAPIEFIVVSEAIFPLLAQQRRGGMPQALIYTDLAPAELGPRDTRFIVAETSLDAEQVIAWWRAAQLHAEALGVLAGDPPKLADALQAFGWAFFYAVLRAGVPAELDAILARGRGDWDLQQSRGIEQRVIPAIDRARHKLVMEALSLLSRLIRIDPRRPSPTLLARVLAEAPLPRPVALLALEVFDQRGLERPEAYGVLATKFPNEKKDVERFIQALRLRATVGQDPRIARSITAAVGNLPDPLAELATWGIDRWKKLVAEAGSDTGPLAPEAAHTRAIELQLQVEQALPLPSLTQRLVDGDGSWTNPVLGKLLPMLTTYADEARSLLARDPVKVGPNGAMPPKAAAVVTNLGRYLGAGVTLEGGLSLVDQGIPSPGVAITYGRDVLTEMLLKRYPQPVITAIANNLLHTANAANGYVFSLVNNWRYGGWLGTSGGSPVPPQVAESSPTLRGLFGNLDDCVCRPCESVLSLSAYLVDLLNLLKTVPKSGATGAPPPTAQSELRARRPDVFQIDLGCETAEAEVLHIDLAIDVMAGELGTSPDTQLATAPYPWGLPLDRGFTELQPTAELLGLARDTLLPLTALPPAADLAAATLGIAQTQTGATLSGWALITTPRSGNDLADAWGVPRGASISINDPDSDVALTGSLPTVLGRASVLLERLGLELDALDAVLATRYVGGLALANRQQCKASEMMLAGQPEAVFDRLHRFTRLARHMPAWSVPLVDSALLTCQLPATGRQASDYASALQTLAAAERARLALKLAPEVVLAMRMPLADIRLKPSSADTLWAREFKLLIGAIAAGGTITANLDLVAGSFGCDSRELAMLVAATGSAPKADQVGDLLNTDNLTWLYRHVHLARALQLTVPQLVALKLATDIDPFALVTPALTPQAGFERLAALNNAAERMAASAWPVAVAADVLVPMTTLAQLANRLPGLGVEPMVQPARVTALLIELQTVLRQATAEVQAARSAVQVERLLHAWIGHENAARVLTALVAASEKGAAGRLGAAPDAAVVALLASATRAEYAPSNTAPLFTTAAAVTLLKPNAGTTDVVATRLTTLRDRLANRERDRQLVAALQAATALPADVVAHLLVAGLSVVTAGGVASSARQVLLDNAFWKSAPADAAAPPLDATARPDLHEWIVRLHKLAALVRIGGEDSAWLRMTARVRPAGAGKTGIDWSSVIAPRQPTSGTTWVPASFAWAACVELRALLEPGSLGAATVTAHFEAMATGTGAVRDVDLEPLASRLDISTAELRALAVLADGTVSREILSQPTALRRLLALAEHLGAVGCTAAQATRVLAANANADGARVLRQLAQARGGHAAALTKLDDSLRIKHRDALVALLLHKKGWRGTDRILEHCLIDPLVQPCLRTTVTLEAVGAVQQFVQRVLFGLEPGLSTVTELRRRWSWMRSYRVWEANRKVFLFPENWLFPELRDDKSSSFRLLESALGQGELNDERARQAFGGFLDDVVLMGQVQVLGMYDDAEWDASVPPKRIRRTLYAVGRTTNPPYLYYWRRCEDFGGVGMEWGGWQRVELDIQGDHVLPYVHRGALCLAWPVLTERQSSSQWQLSFEWSRLDGGGWRRAEGARKPLDLAPVAFRTRDSAFTFRCLVENEGVRLGCYALPVPQNSLSANPGQAASSQRSGTLTAQVRNEFNGQCVVGRWQRYGHLVSRFDENIVRYQVQALGPNSDDHMDAIHGITWECWIKATHGSDTGYVRIDCDPGGPTGARFLLQTSVEGQSAFARQVGWGLGFWVVHYPPNQFSIPEVTCRAEYYFGGRIQTSADLVLPTVANGEYRYTHLRMVIEPRAGQQPPTLAELGISVPASQLRPVAAFLVPDFGEGRWDDHTALPVPPYHPGTSGLFNGMQGGDADSWPLYLPETPPSFSYVIPAVGLPGGQTRRDYWLLPVSDQPTAVHGSTAWLYREGATASFLDVRRAATGFHVNGYAASFPEAVPLRRSWQQTQTLEPAQALTITYGAAALQAPANTANPDLWRNQVSGASAFDLAVPYACYSWEVFFHAPLLIADQLSKQQRFEEAERWLRFVFDPTSGGSSSDPKRFLKFRVFKDLDPSNNVRQQLTLLAQVAAGTSSANVDEITQLVARWRDMPFRPFVIARRRHVAFLWRTMFAYLDNLLAWADSLYRRDTRESIGEATLLYVLVARILGPRPKLREKGSQRPARTYDSAQGAWDDFGNLWVDTSIRIRQLGWNLGSSGNASALPSADGFLFFCLPYNDKLFSYWNLVESRLFNIRHCRNIEGISRTLLLTDPPIDPELLVRATAAGLDLGQVIAGLYAPPPHYRFSALAARASELAAETRTLGGALLAAIEKRDAERVSQLRSSNELSMLERVKAVRQLQIDEAEANLAALRATRALTESRYEQYQRLLGREDSKAPAAGATGGDESMLGRPSSGASAASGLGLIEQEGKQIEYLGHAYGWSVAGGVVKGIGATAHMAASIAAATGVGAIGAEVLKSVGSSLSTTGDMFELVSRGWQHGASHESLMAGHYRRRDEWAFQSNQALRELRQVDRQILANEIRIALARKELENQQLQFEQSQAIDEFLHDKFSSADLYDWMVQQISTVHFAAYRMAREMALRAQAAAARELGGAPLNVIGHSHWDGLRSGLLAGERLHHEVKRLEVNFLERNVREHEMTKHVSLRRLDPQALVLLKTQGDCEFELPEWLFDLDAPGHYARRLKSLSLSVPCVVGPYASVNFKLILLNSRTRVSTDDVQTTANYVAKSADPRFDVRYGAAESIVTSSGRDDSGLFETALRDERFLPFEGAGAIFRARVERLGSPPQFDPDTISDVILHLRYTARDGGESMRDSARGQFASASSAAAVTPPLPMVLLSAKTDFAAEWAQAKDGGTMLKVQLDKNLLPYWMLKAGLNIVELGTIDIDGSPTPRLNSKWRRNSGQQPTGFALTSGGGLSASLGSASPNLEDRLILLTMGP